MIIVKKMKWEMGIIDGEENRKGGKDKDILVALV